MQRKGLRPRARGQVLAPNIAACGADASAAVHTGRAEDFLRRARSTPAFCDAAFDYVRRVLRHPHSEQLRGCDKLV